jgi:uncharacterized repeat protein (TIGR03803 family)
MRKLSLWRGSCIVCVFCALPVGAVRAKAFRTLVSFNGTDGASPSSLVQGLDGDLYGTTFAGGANGEGTVFKSALRGNWSPFIAFVLNRTALTATHLAQGSCKLPTEISMARQ